MRTQVEIRLLQQDITTLQVDVLALKHAQGFYGVDKAIIRKLGTSFAKHVVAVDDGEHLLLPTRGAIPAAQVLFVGTPQLNLFTYATVRALGRNVMTSLRELAPLTRTIAMTIHGPGFGLDEVECTQQLFRGFVDAISKSDFPPNLKTIFLVERDEERYQLLGKVLKDFSTLFEVPSSTRPIPAGQPGPRFTLNECPTADNDEVTTKHKIFVAMPFAKNMRDVWTLGIQQTVHELGLLCERLDEEAFTGDIVTQIKNRIQGAALVIADISGNNPNVFLEIGYAWGTGRDTVLLVRKVEGSHDRPAFDVLAQRRIEYEDVTDLREQLASELIKLGLAQPKTKGVS